MEDKFIELLNWRSIDRDEFCDACAGSGVRTYGGTSTWRGGIGGQMMTADVCDECWGSGSRSVKWPSHKLFSSTIRERDALKSENEKLKDNIIEVEKVIFQLRNDLAEAVRIARKNESEFDDEHVEFYCGFCPKILSDCHKKPCADRKFLSRFPVQEKGSEGVV